MLSSDVKRPSINEFINKRDAWGFGALDPNSGTAQMMEVARVMGERLKTGWRPRRTIMFLSWGAEEYSLCGSREFVEQYEMEVSERWGTEAYISPCLYSVQFSSKDFIPPMNCRWDGPDWCAHTILCFIGLCLLTHTLYKASHTFIQFRVTLSLAAARKQDGIQFSISSSYVDSFYVPSYIQLSQLTSR